MGNVSFFFVAFEEHFFNRVAIIIIILLLLNSHRHLTRRNNKTKPKICFPTLHQRLYDLKIPIIPVGSCFLLQSIFPHLSMAGGVSSCTTTKAATILILSIHRRKKNEQPVLVTRVRCHQIYWKHQNCSNLPSHRKHLRGLRTSKVLYFSICRIFQKGQNFVCNFALPEMFHSVSSVIQS